MPHTTPCAECSRSGLPILFTRYAAAYSATTEGHAALDTLTPRGPLQAAPGGVALKAARYGLRLLRAGYLYIRTEAAGIRTPEWLAYVVHPHGYLTRIDIHTPWAARALPACRPNEWGANRSLAWIGDVDALTALHFMFHPDPIEYEHLVKRIGQAPDAFMQCFDIAGWVKGHTAQKDTCDPAQLDAQVMEFAALGSASVQDVGNEQHFGLMGCTPLEREWGNYDAHHEGRHFADTAGGAALGPVRGAHTVAMVQADYRQRHGQRLEGMRRFLIERKGAVLACEDAIGIAQELSLHHLTAAIPYTRWLRQQDAQGVNNQFKQAASASIATVQSALQKSVMRAYDQETERLRWNAARVVHPTLSAATYHVTQPDGSVKAMGEHDYNLHLQNQWNEEADMRDADRAKFNGVAVARTEALHDRAARAAFDASHLAQLQAREKHMDAIAADLQLWLGAPALVERALSRYDANADPTRSRDGIHCAGQLCAILLQIDSTPRGREWLASLDTFAPSSRNLVWRMACLNNATISAELDTALKQLRQPLPSGERKTQDVYKQASDREAIAQAAEVLATLTTLLKSADAIDKAHEKLNDPLTRGMARYSAYCDIGKAAQASLLSVLLVAVMARVKKLPPTQLETHIARAQVATLAHGLGSQAPAFVKSDMTASIQGRRVPIALGALSLLAIIPTAGTAAVKHDARSISEASASAANGMGLVKGWKASFYEETVFKQVPHRVAAQELPNALKGAGQKLQSLKADAARYVIAGTVVGVWWDAVDGRIASNEDDRPLVAAYTARAFAGVSTIATTIADVAVTGRTAALWISRINICLGIITAASTFALNP